MMIMIFLALLCLGGWSPPEAYGSRRVSEGVIPRDTVRIFSAIAEH